MRAAKSGLPVERAAGPSSAAARRAQPLKSYLGPLAYPLGAVRAAVTESPLRCTVCADSTYVRHTPSLTMIGTLFEGQRIKVTRYDKSGKDAYGFAYGHVRKHGWVKTADLCH